MGWIVAAVLAVILILVVCLLMLARGGLRRIERENGDWTRE